MRVVDYDLFFWGVISVVIGVALGTTAFLSIVTDSFLVHIEMSSKIFLFILGVIVGYLGLREFIRSINWYDD